MLNPPESQHTAEALTFNLTLTLSAEAAQCLSHVLVTEQKEFINKTSWMNLSFFLIDDWLKKYFYPY